MTAIVPQPEFADILQQQETFAIEGDESFGNRINEWFDRLMLQSGWNFAASTVLALCLLSGLTLGGLVFVWQENLLTTAMASFTGFLAPILIAMVVRSRRQSQMSQQLPGMIDELARAARTGRSLESCLSLVADDTPAPLGTELQFCARKMTLGLNVDEALQQLPSRTGLVSTSVLATALSVHRQSGGDLIHVLDRLSQTIRDRQQFQGRLKAATAASRATAMLMLVVPPAVITFFTIRDPGYFSTLMSTSWGWSLTMLAIGLQIVGTISVILILRNSQRA